MTNDDDVLGLSCRSRWPGRTDVLVALVPGGTIYDALKAGGRPIASSCTGDAVCGRCTVRILDGETLVAPPDDDERAVLARVGAESGSRLACRLRTDEPGLVVGTDYW